MNCRRFENGLDEYVDGALSPRKRAAADRHLADCAACREALRRYRQIGQVLSHSFRQATQSLRLRPEVQQRVLRELADRAAAAADRRRVGWCFARPVWPWAAATGLVVVALMATVLLLRQPGGSPSRPPDLGPVASIHVSHQVPIYHFQREGSTVRDSLTYQTVVVNGSLWPERNRK